MRRPECVRHASLDFHENQRRHVAIATDQVDFAASLGPKILVQYAIAIFPKVICGDFLSPLAESKVGGKAAATELSQPAPCQDAPLQSILLPQDSRQSGNRSEPPEQTIGDESGMDRESEASRYAPVSHSLYSREIRSADIGYATHASYGPESPLQ